MYIKFFSLILTTVFFFSTVDAIHAQSLSGYVPPPTLPWKQSFRTYQPSTWVTKSCTQTITTTAQLATAVTNLKAGDVICVAPGNYKQTINITNLRATAANPVIIKTTSAVLIGDNYTYPGTGTRSEACLRFPNCLPSNFIPMINILNSSYVYLQGFHITEALGRGVSIKGSDNVIIENFKIYNNRSAAIHVEDNGATSPIPSSYVKLLYNEIWGNNNNAPFPRTPDETNGGLNWPVIVRVRDRSHHVDIIGNRVFQNWGEGIASGDAHDINIYGNEVLNEWAVSLYFNHDQNINVAYNLVYITGNWPGNPVNCFSFNNEDKKGQDQTPPTKNIKVYNNVGYGCPPGFFMGAQQLTVNTEDVFIYHNTIANPDNKGNAAGRIFSVGKPNYINIQIQDNLFYRQTGTTNLLSIAAGADLRFRNNYWNTTPNGITSTTEIINATLPFANQPPQLPFTAPLNLNTLKPANNFIGKDRSTKAFPVIDDFFGCRRDANPDLGAIEVNGTGCNTTDPLPTATSTPSQPTLTPTPTTTGPVTPGTNLLPNANFQFADISFYQNRTEGTGTGVTFSHDANIGHLSTRSLKIAATDQLPGTLSRWFSQALTTPATPGQTYRIAVWTRLDPSISDGTVGTVQLVTNFWNSSTPNVPIENSSSISVTEHTNQQWILLSIDATAPANTQFIRAEMRLNGNGVAYFDDISIAPLISTPPTATPTLTPFRNLLAKWFTNQTDQNSDGFFNILDWLNIFN